jgi:hypothetical protein
MGDSIFEHSFVLGAIFVPENAFPFSFAQAYLTFVFQIFVEFEVEIPDLVDLFVLGFQLLDEVLVVYVYIDIS